MAVQAARMRSVDPATGETIAEFDVMGEADVDRALAQAHAVFPGWRDAGFTERARLMRTAAERLRGDRERLARIITAEMGKVIAEAEAEVEKCAFACDYYAENAARFLADEPFPSDVPGSFVAFEPLGVVLAVMPWNFPLWQVFRFAAPNLMAGNTAVLKHAANVSRCALEIEDVFRHAGFPEGAFRTLLLPGDRVGSVIADPRVRAVTLTGSDTTGSKVAAAAGEHLKKTVLELGGSDAFIVLADADLEAAATTAVRSRFQNAGQSCIAAKRFIVVEAVAAEFESKMAATAARLKVGDPREPGVDMGPLAREDLRQTLEGQLEQSLQAGARLLTGGARAGQRGWFFEPTVITDCTLEMPAVAEETFGPLAAVIRVSGEDEAVDIANRSQYGLGGNLWTGDVERGVALARRLETGGVFINGMTHSDPRLPFGGVKRSGYGRELSSFGIREFVNVQTIWLPGEQDGRRPSVAVE